MNADLAATLDAQVEATLGHLERVAREGEARTDPAACYQLAQDLRLAGRMIEALSRVVKVLPLLQSIAPDDLRAAAAALRRQNEPAHHLVADQLEAIAAAGRS